MIGTEIPAAVRRRLTSIPELVIQVDVEHDAKGLIDVAAILERFRRPEQHAVIAMLLQQPLHAS